MALPAVASSNVTHSNATAQHPRTLRTNLPP